MQTQLRGVVILSRDSTLLLGDLLCLLISHLIIYLMPSTLLLLLMLFKDELLNSAHLQCSILSSQKKIINNKLARLPHEVDIYYFNCIGCFRRRSVQLMAYYCTLVIFIYAIRPYMNHKGTNLQKSSTKVYDYHFDSSLTTIIFNIFALICKSYKNRQCQLS